MDELLQTLNDFLEYLLFVITMLATLVLLIVGVTDMVTGGIIPGMGYIFAGGTTLLLHAFVRNL